MSDYAIYEEKKWKVLKLWMTNMTSSEVAKKTGMTRSAVMGIVYRARLGGLIMPRARDKPVKTEKSDAPKPVVKRQPQKLAPKKKEEPPPKPVVEVRLPPPPPSPPPTGIPFIQLNSNTCKFAISGRTGRSYMFCGEPVDRKSYCKKHADMCYVPLIVGARSKKRFRLTRLAGDR